MGTPKILTIFLLILFIDCSISRADELRLKNGDRITGKVIAMEKNKLVFNTTYAGEITLEWHEVANLTSESPITVKMGDGTTSRHRTPKKQTRRSFFRWDIRMNSQKLFLVRMLDLPGKN